MLTGCSYMSTLKTISGRLLMFYLTLNVGEIMRNVSEQTVTLDRPVLYSFLLSSIHITKGFEFE